MAFCEVDDPTSKQNLSVSRRYPMSWVTVLWSMNAAACLTFAAIYFVVWCKQRESGMYLAFSCSAVAAAALTAFELALLRAQAVEQYSAVLRWAQLPVWTLVLSLVIFVRLYFRAGRLWLAWSVCGVRTLALILNFVLIPNLSYREITSLRQLSWWGGETVSVPVGVTNPWILVAQLSSLLLIIFFVDATITVWRRGDGKRGLGVAAALTLFSLIAVGQALLVVWGIIHVPFLACFAILGLLATMGYELCSDIFQSAQLARKLNASQAALRKTEQDMEIAANAVDLAVWTWDIARDEVWLSNKARAVFGFSPSERLTPERIRSVIHPEDRDLLRKAVKDSLQTGAENPIEYRVVLPGGEIRWLVRRSRTEFDRNGKPILMHGVLFDITERKFAEERFRLVVNAAPTAMIMANKEGRIALINKRVETLFGYKDDELIGKPVEILIPKRFRSHHAAYRDGYFSDAQARPMGAGRELFGRRKDGSEIPIEIGLNPVHTSKGLCVLTSIIDISERKQAELEAARQRHDLAHLARVTTVGELSTSLAHELIHPLTSILSNAQAAQRFLSGDDVDLDEVREILDDIVAEDERASEVIHRLRLLLKKGEVQKHCTDVDLNEVVHDILKLMRNDLINRNVTVDTDLAQNLPAIAGDRVQLQQVLLNLMLNACEAINGNNPSERRLLVASKMENSGVRVSVTDRGRGIPEEKLEQVFERFFTTKRNGMGLGLSVCRTIINAHRGKIWATNNAGCGTTFHFRLPIVPIVRSERRQCPDLEQITAEPVIADS
jgi:two-component system, LuxR family, sensor kinase FixL